MSYKNFKYAALGACAVSALLASSDAHAQAQQVLGATADVTVQNAFSLVETTPMEFGTLVVICDTGAANTTNATLNPAGALAIAPASGAARIIDIDAAAPNPRSAGIFDVTGAAPSTALTVTVGNPVNMTCSSCTGGNPAITLGNLTNNAPGNVLTTDNAGDATLNVGARITTLGTCPQQYEDGLYRGTYDVTVSY